MFTDILNDQRRLFVSKAKFPTTGIEDIPPFFSGSPREFSLQQNYPNPFNSRTQFLYYLPHPMSVTLSVFDIMGHEVKTLMSGMLGTGAHMAFWDGTDSIGIPVASGVYFARLQAGQYQQVKKMMLLR